jgi:hypothetical protein
MSNETTAIQLDIYVCIYINIISVTYYMWVVDRYNNVWYDEGGDSPKKKEEEEDDDP